MSERDGQSTQSFPVEDIEKNKESVESSSNSLASDSNSEVISETLTENAPAQEVSDTGASYQSAQSQLPNISIDPSSVASTAGSASGSASVAAAATTGTAAAATGLSGGAIAAIVVGVLLVAAVVVGVLAFNPLSSPEISQAQKQLGIDPNAGEYEEPEQQAASSGIAIPGWQKIEVPAGQTEVTVNFNNPDDNDGKYYLTFELRLKDTGETLYSSALVPPGKTIQHITLSRPLDVGEYQAIMHVQPYKMDESQTKTNNADMETVLVVK